jgi:hypothetical protein
MTITTWPVWDGQQRVRVDADGLAMSTNVAEQTMSASWRYLRGMEIWTAAVHELLAHAVEVVEGPSVRGRLMGARDDAESLRDLLRTATQRDDPNPTATATIESICSLWDANEHYFEQLAAEADPAFYERWTASVEAARAGKHGAAATGSAPATTS